MSENLPIVLIEGVLIFGGVLLFAWWQLRSLKRDQAKTAAERAARESAAQAAASSAAPADEPAALRAHAAADGASPPAAAGHPPAPR